MTTKLQALADQLCRKATAGIQLDGGLALVRYTGNQLHVVRFGRARVPLSEREIMICKPAFAVPPTADRYDYAREPDWRTVQFSWIPRTYGVSGEWISQKELKQ